MNEPFAALIDRLTAAEQGGEKLDREVALHLGWRQSEDVRDPVWINPDGGIFVTLPSWTTSAQEASALFPDGWRHGYEMQGKFDQVDLVEAWCWPFESDFKPDWRNGDEGYRSSPDALKCCAKTPPLAMCVSALHARQKAGFSV